jgi:hypothetical protein
MPEYINAEQLAERLQFTPQFIRRMARAGKIPSVPFKFGSKVYYRFSLPDVIASVTNPRE